MGKCGAPRDGWKIKIPTDATSRDPLINWKNNRSTGGSNSGCGWAVGTHPRHIRSVGTHPQHTGRGVLPLVPSEGVGGGFSPSARRFFHSSEAKLCMSITYPIRTPGTLRKAVRRTKSETLQARWCKIYRAEPQWNRLIEAKPTSLEP